LHPFQDFCLQSIAQTIKDRVTENNDYTFCRYGGEEFALILPAVMIEEGRKIAKQIQATIQLLKIPHISSEISDIVTLSIGVAAMVPNRLKKSQELIQSADSALYLSKTKGRNTVSTVQVHVEGL
jgi:diguanylate cyclase (GGDEF)-like protein